METFSFNPLINLFEESKWLLTVIGFETTNSVLNITHEKKCFSITIEGPWSSRGNDKNISKLQKLSEMRQNNDIELHVEEVRKRRYQMKIGDEEYKLTDLDTRKKEITEELKNAEYNDRECMVHRIGLTYTETEYKLDTKYIATSSAG